MKYFLPIFLIFSLNSANAEHAPVKHSIDPTCQYQVANRIINQTVSKYGRIYKVLNAGLYVEIYAKLESFPTISLSKSVITMRHRFTGIKYEVYYSGKSGSIGLEANGQPIHKCRVAVEQINQFQYEGLTR